MYRRSSRSTVLLAACTLLLVLLQAPAEAVSSHRKLQGGGKTVKNRQDNELRASVATSDSILLAVRKGPSSAGIGSATKDGMALARLSSSASATPSDFAAGASDNRRRLMTQQRKLAHAAAQDDAVWDPAAANSAGVTTGVTSGVTSNAILHGTARKLQQGKIIGSSAAMYTWSVSSTAEDIQEAAMGGAQMKAVLEATQMGNKWSRQVSSRNSEPTDFDKKKTSGD